MSKPTKEELAQYLSYNTETGKFHWIKKTSSSSRIIIGNEAGCKHKHGYIVIWFKLVAYKAHDLAFVFVTGQWPTSGIVHLTERDDNRFENLRMEFNIRGLPVTQELLKLCFNYDEETGIFTRLLTVNVNAKEGSIAGGINKDGYIVISVGLERHYAHRLAVLYMTGSWPSGHVDHINSTTKSNAWSNLRDSTVSENMYNTKLRSDNKSGYKGIFWMKNISKWLAYITKDKVRTNLGYYTDKEEAIKVIREARELLHYDYANHG